MTKPSVSQLRVVLHPEVFDDALAFYRDSLGLRESGAFAGPNGARVVILEAGRATLELANQAQAEFISSVESHGAASTPVRLAFEVDDAAAATEAFTAAGARVIAPPQLTPWNSLNSRLEGSAGVQVTLFQELIPAGGGEGRQLVGADLTSLGGERGVLARSLRTATRHGAAGQLPFAAVVVRGGVVIGTGVNTAMSDHDPSAHAEIVAIRDAGQRTASAALSGAVIYSSCEPCAICRTVAAAAGVLEIIFAAGKELVPAQIDPSPEFTSRLIEAVTAVLPGIARPTTADFSQAELSDPFQAYLKAVAP